MTPDAVMLLCQVAEVWQRLPWQKRFPVDDEHDPAARTADFSFVALAKTASGKSLPITARQRF